MLRSYYTNYLFLDNNYDLFNYNKSIAGLILYPKRYNNLIGNLLSLLLTPQNTPHFLQSAEGAHGKEPVKVIQGRI